MCIALGAASREWSISLPDCEEVVALGATEKLVAVATDARYLRIFSVMGTQREMLSLPGPAVAISGHGDMLCVVYHGGAAADGAQNLSAILVQAIGFSLRVTDIRMPLTPGTKLGWLGFSDKGSPVCADSLGMVRLYSAKSNYWMPICDLSLHVKKILSERRKISCYIKKILLLAQKRIRHILSACRIRAQSNRTSNFVSCRQLSNANAEADGVRAYNADTTVRLGVRESTNRRVASALC